MRSVSVPPRSRERCCSSKSSMLMRSAPSACVMPARMPGGSGTWTRSRCNVPGCSYASASMRRRLSQASPIQRARNPAAPEASACSPCSTRRRCSASPAASPSALSRKMSTQMRGFAPATRVRSRKDPPAAASTAATCAGNAATGAATMANSARETASPREDAASTAPRSLATASASGSTSHPRTSPTPASRAANPTEAPINPVPTIATRWTDTALPDLAAHQLGKGADLVREVRKVGDGNLLRSVAERFLGPRMHLDDDPVRAGGDSGARQRQHELAATGGMQRIDDHREVRLLLQHGNGADVERVPRRPLERRDAPLAEDHLRVALLHDVLRGHQQLLDRRRRPALQQHRLVGASDLGQKVEVLHVARA